MRQKDENLFQQFVFLSAESFYFIIKFTFSSLLTNFIIFWIHSPFIISWCNEKPRPIECIEKYENGKNEDKRVRFNKITWALFWRTSFGYSIQLRQICSWSRLRPSSEVVEFLLFLYPTWFVVKKNWGNVVKIKNVSYHQSTVNSNRTKNTKAIPPSIHKSIAFV